MVKKILVDTDIGSDIDDALALTYLLSQPECKLLGITTVSGEAEKRASLASAICTAYGQQIPIFPGFDNTLTGGIQLQPQAQQASALSQYPHQSRFPSNMAIDFLQQTIRENPRQITLLGLGPLTNIAALFRKDPEIPSLLKEFVMMSGIFSDHFESYEAWTVPEWNCRVDPQAAAEVYQNCPLSNQIIGLDTSAQVYLSSKQVETQLLQFLPSILTEMTEIWFTGRKYVAFHDPLAATTIFNKNICKFKNVAVNVSLNEGKQSGITRIIDSLEGKKVNIAVGVDPNAFFDHYFSVLRTGKEKSL